ncbi:MAG TPA: Asp-tRNA(Asn)/Glu-tRNA(Gln) amidotransferase subunit GatA [Candidatus Bipolaricaulota bacterium]|nr:Asp-tRNA(Asn)/Glu-tRNA(Gln) amidotransferase subunit GatA [Candidatus Bipolaricaulota bacterium]
MLNKLTIKSAQRGLREKEFSCAELIKDCLKQIEKRQPEINAFLTVMEGDALARAKVVDEKISSGLPLKTLEGIPLAIKDIILIEDVHCTCASKIMRNYVAPYNATVIEKLNEQNAVYLGKTNLDEFAMGASTENSAFGAVKNPFNPERVAGGSSGGSAAAVADDQCLGALGTDTGGSVRQPAALCGCVGLKPTYGRVSRYGVAAMASSLDQVGPLAKTAEDAAMILQTIYGQDRFDSTSVSRQDDFLQNLEKPLKGLTIGLPEESFFEGLDRNVFDDLKKSIKILEQLKVKIKRVELPYFKYSLAAYYILMSAEVSSNMARYDGVKYGQRAAADDLMNMYLKTREAGFGEEVKRRIMMGTYVLSEGYSDAYYKQAQKVRALIKHDFAKAFKKVDAVIMPTAPSIAFKIGEKVKDPLQMYLADVYTVSANVAGLPAISVPMNQVGEFPTGLQILGNYFDEATILRVAHQFEQSF